MSKADDGISVSDQMDVMVRLTEPNPFLKRYGLG